MRLALVVEEELGEVARLAPAPRAATPMSCTWRVIELAAELELQHAEGFHRRGHRRDLVAGDLLDPRHHLVGVVEAVEVVRLDDDVGEEAVQPVAHLRRRTRP